MPMQYDPNHGPLTDIKWVAPDGREGFVKKRAVDGAYWLTPEDGAPTRGWWHYIGSNEDGTLQLGQAASVANLPTTEAFQWGKDQTMKRVKDGAIWLDPKMDPRVTQAGFHVFDQAGNPTMDQAAVARANTGFLPASGRFIAHGAKEVYHGVKNWGAQTAQDARENNRGVVTQGGLEVGKAVLGAGRSVERLSTLAGPLVKGVSALVGSEKGKRAGEIIAREGLSSIAAVGDGSGSVLDRAAQELEVERMAQEYSDAADRVTYASVTGKLRQVQNPLTGEIALEGSEDLLKDVQRCQELHPQLLAAQANLAATTGQSTAYNEVMDRGVGANVGNLIGEGVQVVATMGASKTLGTKLATALAKANNPILKPLALAARPLVALESEAGGLAKAATATKRGALKSLVTSPKANLMRVAGRLEEAALMNLPGAAQEVAQRVGAGEDVLPAIGHTAKGQPKAALSFAPMLSSRVARLAKVADQATKVGAAVNTGLRLGALTASSTLLDALTDGAEGLSRAPEHMKNLLYWELSGGLKAHRRAKGMAEVVRDAKASRKAINAIDVLMQDATDPEDIAELTKIRGQHSTFLEKAQSILDKFNDGRNEEGVKKPAPTPETAAQREQREFRKAAAKEVMEDEARTRAQAGLLGKGKREEAEDQAAMDAFLAAMDHKPEAPLPLEELNALINEKIERDGIDPEYWKEHLWPELKAEHEGGARGSHVAQFERLLRREQYDRPKDEEVKKEDPAEVLDYHGRSYSGTTTRTVGGKTHRTWFTPKELRETPVRNADVEEYLRLNANGGIGPDFSTPPEGEGAKATAARRRAAIKEALELATKEKGATLGERLAAAVDKAAKADPEGRIAQAFERGGQDAREWFSEELRDHAARRRKSDEGARLRGMESAAKGRQNSEGTEPGAKTDSTAGGRAFMRDDGPAVHTEASARAAMQARIAEREASLATREAEAPEGVAAEREALAKLKARLEDPAPLVGDKETLRRAQNLGIHRGETIMPEGVTNAFKRAATSARERVEVELQDALEKANQEAQRLPREFHPVENGDPSARIREYLKAPVDQEGNPLSEAAEAYRRPALEAAAARVEDARARLQRASALEREASSGFEGGIKDPALARHAHDHLRSLDLSGKVDEAASQPHIQATLAHVPEVANGLRQGIEAERERIQAKSKEGSWREPEHQANAMHELEQREARLASLELLRDAAKMAKDKQITLADAVRQIHDGTHPANPRRKFFRTRGEALDAVRRELDRIEANHEGVVDGPLVDLAVAKEHTAKAADEMATKKAEKQKRLEEEAAGLERKRQAAEAADLALKEGRAKGLPDAELRSLGVVRDLRSREYAAAKASHQKALDALDGHETVSMALKGRVEAIEGRSAQIRTDKTLREQATSRWRDEVLGHDSLRDSDGHEAAGLRRDMRHPGRALDRSVTAEQRRDGAEPFLMNRAEAKRLVELTLTPEEVVKVREELKDPNSELHEVLATDGKGAIVPARAAAVWSETASGSRLASKKLAQARYVEHHAYRLEEVRQAIRTARGVIGSKLENEPEVRSTWKGEKAFEGYTIGDPSGAGRRVSSIGGQAFRPAQDAITEFRGNEAFLSNMVRSPVSLDGVVYPTVEHALQAAKTLDPAERQKILAAEKAGDAKRLGGPKGVITKREGHDAESTAVLKALLHQKFRNPRLREALLKTGERELVEGNLHRDEVWGATKKGDGAFVGQNRLGRLLMEVRQEIRDGKAPELDNLELGTVAPEVKAPEKGAPEPIPGTRFKNHPAAADEVAHKAIAAFDRMGGAALRFESTEALLDRLAAHGALEVTNQAPAKTFTAGGEVRGEHSLTGETVNAMEAIRRGEKTASTRIWKETPAVGEMIRMDASRSGQPGADLIVTGVEPISLEQAMNPAWVAEWSARNGRNTEYFQKAILPQVHAGRDVLEVRYERPKTFGLEAREIEALTRVMDQTHQPETDPRLASYEAQLAAQRRKSAAEDLAGQDENATRLFSDEAARVADLGGDLRDYTVDGARDYDKDSFERPAADREEQDHAAALAKNWQETKELAQRAFDKLFRAGVIMPGDVKLEREGKLAASDTLDAAVASAATRLEMEAIRPGSETAPEAEKALEAMNALTLEHRNLVQEGEGGGAAKLSVVEAARQRRLAKRALDGIVRGLAEAPDLDPHVVGIIQEHLATVASDATHEGDVLLEHLAGYTSTRDWDGEFRVPRLSSDAARQRAVDWHGTEAGRLVDEGGARMAKEDLEALADPAHPRHAETVEAFSGLLREIGIDPELERPDLLPTTRIKTTTPEDLRITALAQAQKFLDDVAATKEHQEVLNRWKRESKGILHKDWENRVKLFEGNFAEGSLERALAGSFIRALHPELARRVAAAETSRLAEAFAAQGDGKMADRAAEMEARGSIASFDARNNLVWLHSAWSDMRLNPLRGGEAWRALSHEIGHFVVQAMDPSWHVQTAEAYSRWIQKASSKSELMRRLGLDTADRAAELAHGERIVLSDREAQELLKWADTPEGEAELRMLGADPDRFADLFDNDGTITTFNWAGMVDAATSVNRDFYKFRNADEWWAEAWKGFISEASSGRLARRGTEKMEGLLDGLSPQDVKRMMAAGDVLRAMDKAGRNVPLQASKPIVKALRAMFGPDAPAFRSSDPMTVAAALRKHGAGCEVLDLKSIDPNRFKTTRRPEGADDWASIVAEEEGMAAGRSFLATEIKEARASEKEKRAGAGRVGVAIGRGGEVKPLRPHTFTPEPEVRNTLLEKLAVRRAWDDAKAQAATTSALQHGFGKGAVARALAAAGNLVDAGLYKSMELAASPLRSTTSWVISHIAADAMNANSRKFGGWMQYEDARDTSARTLDEVRSEALRRAFNRDHGHLFTEKVQRDVASIVKQTAEAMARGKKTRTAGGADIFQYDRPIEETGETCRFLGRTTHSRENEPSFFLDRWEVMHQGEKFLVATNNAGGKNVGIVRIMPQKVFDLYRHLEEGGERSEAFGPRTNAYLENWKQHKQEMDAWRWNELTEVHGVDLAALDAARVKQYFPHIYAMRPKRGGIFGRKTAQDNTSGIGITEQNGMDHGMDDSSLVNLDRIKARKYQTLNDAWERGGLLPRHDNPIEAYMQAGRDFQAMTSLRRTVGAMIDRGLAVWSDAADRPAGMVEFPLDRSLGSALDALGFKGNGSKGGHKGSSLYVDKSVAPLIRNGFKKGLSGTPLREIHSKAMAVNNVLTPIKLTLSAFHLGTITKLGLVESVRSVASAYAQERRQAKLEGRDSTRTECIARAAERMGSHAALYGAKREGNRIHELLLEHGMKNLDQLRQESGLSDLDKATMVMFQLGNYSRGIRPSLENANLDEVVRRWTEFQAGGKKWNLVPMTAGVARHTVSELQSRLMEGVVSPVKAGHLSTDFQRFLKARYDTTTDGWFEEFARDAFTAKPVQGNRYLLVGGGREKDSPYQTSEAQLYAKNMVSHADNVFGLVNYRRLMMHPILKDLAQAWYLSFGWRMGNTRLALKAADKALNYTPLVGAAYRGMKRGLGGTGIHGAEAGQNYLGYIATHTAVDALINTALVSLGALYWPKTMNPLKRDDESRLGAALQVFQDLMHPALSKAPNASGGFTRASLPGYGNDLTAFFDAGTELVRYRRGKPLFDWATDAATANSSVSALLGELVDGKDAINRQIGGPHGLGLSKERQEALAVWMDNPNTNAALELAVKTAFHVAHTATPIAITTTEHVHNDLAVPYWKAGLTGLGMRVVKSSRVIGESGATREGILQRHNKQMQNEKGITPSQAMDMNNRSQAINQALASGEPLKLDPATRKKYFDRSTGQPFDRMHFIFASLPVAGRVAMLEHATDAEARDLWAMGRAGILRGVQSAKKNTPIQGRGLEQRVEELKRRMQKLGVR